MPGLRASSACGVGWGTERASVPRPVWHRTEQPASSRRLAVTSAGVKGTWPCPRPVPCRVKGDGPRETAREPLVTTSPAWPNLGRRHHVLFSGLLSTSLSLPSVAGPAAAARRAPGAHARGGGAARRRPHALVVGKAEGISPIWDALGMARQDRRMSKVLRHVPLTFVKGYVTQVSRDAPVARPSRVVATAGPRARGGAQRAGVRALPPPARGPRVRIKER